MSFRAIAGIQCLFSLFFSFSVIPEIFYQGSILFLAVLEEWKYFGFCIEYRMTERLMSFPRKRESSVLLCHPMKMGIQEAKKNGSPINDFGDDIFVDFGDVIFDDFGDVIFVDFGDVIYLYFTMIPVKANRLIYFKI